MESKEPKKKRYSPPTLTKLTPEQAKTLLADPKNCAEQEAADLLEMPSTAKPEHCDGSKAEALSLDAEISRRIAGPRRKRRHAENWVERLPLLRRP
jgi:hypothetical protein